MSVLYFSAHFSLDALAFEEAWRLNWGGFVPRCRLLPRHDMLGQRRQQCAFVGIVANVGPTKYQHVFATFSQHSAQERSFRVHTRTCIVNGSNVVVLDDKSLISLAVVVELQAFAA